MGVKAGEDNKRAEDYTKAVMLGEGKKGGIVISDREGK